MVLPTIKPLTQCSCAQFYAGRMLKAMEMAKVQYRKDRLISGGFQPPFLVLTFINTVTFVGSATEPRSSRDDSSFFRDLASQAPSANVTVFMKGST